MMPDGDGFSANDPTRNAELRREMVETQLLPRGVDDPRVLEAMQTVPRDAFVPPAYRHLAYEDGPLPIGFGQTISQPFTVAYMAQALKLRGDEKVLEVGTGSGYGAAVLSKLARSVWTIERIPELAESARRKLAELGYENVRVITGDGSIGLPEEAPFDGIVVTAGAPRLPEGYLEQLAEGGRLVIPVGGEGGQVLYAFTRRPDGDVSIEDLGGFVFVPLIGRHGRSAP